MAGQLVPLVLFPRHSTLAGKITDDFFTTIAIDVTPYVMAHVKFWRGPIIGTAPPPPPPDPPPAFRLWFEESTDQEVWTLCDGSPDGADPGANTQVNYGLDLTNRWFRVRVQLYAANNIVS